MSIIDAHWRWCLITKRLSTEPWQRPHAQVCDRIWPRERYKQSSKLSSGQGRVIVLQERVLKFQAMDSWRLRFLFMTVRDQGAIYSLARHITQVRTWKDFLRYESVGNRYRAFDVTDVNAMAQNDLSEGVWRALLFAKRYVWSAKTAFVKEAAKGDDVGSILFNVWNTLTEQPDALAVGNHLPAEIKAVRL